MTSRDSLTVRAAGLRTGNLNSPVTIRLRKNERDRLAHYAREHGVSIADVVRYAVDGLLRGGPSTGPARYAQSSPKKSPSKRSVRPRFRQT